MGTGKGGQRDEAISPRLRPPPRAPCSALHDSPSPATAKTDCCVALSPSLPPPPQWPCVTSSCHCKDRLLRGALTIPPPPPFPSGHVSPLPATAKTGCCVALSARVSMKAAPSLPPSQKLASVARRPM